MEGEDEDSENPRSFNNAKIWKRMIIIIAGAFMNIVLGLVLMLITLLPAGEFCVYDCISILSQFFLCRYRFTAR